MAERNPPIFLQAGSHSAESVRLSNNVLPLVPAGVNKARSGVRPDGTGTNGVGGLNITAGVGMQVLVAAGQAAIQGTESAVQGAYLVSSDSQVALALAAADATNPRNDLVVAKVQDAAYSGATNSWSLAVVTGTPAATPADPATPANAIVLARVRVNAGATSPSTITDLRPFTVGLGGLLPCLSTALPATPYVGMQLYLTDKARKVVWNGTYWDPVSNQPMCQARYTGTTPAGFNIPNNAWTDIPLDVEDFDSDGMHDNVTNNTRFTCVVAGKYQFSGGVGIATSAAGRRGAGLGLNGTDIAGSADLSGQAGAGSIIYVPTRTIVVPMVAGDFVTLRGYQDSGGVLATSNAGNAQSHLTAVRLGP